MIHGLYIYVYSQANSSCTAILNDTTNKTSYISRECLELGTYVSWYKTIIIIMSEWKFCLIFQMLLSTHLSSTRMMFHI